MLLARHSRILASLVAFVFASLLPPDRAEAEPFLELPNGSRVYSSGIDLLGGIDQRYAMTLNPYAPGSATANLNSAGYLSANDSDSAWIGPAFPNVHTPESVYRVRTLIDLTGVSLAGYSITGYWVSDNRGLDILVNGSSTGFTNNGSHPNPPSASEDNRFVLDASSGLVAGVNVVEFEWGNGPAGGAGSQNPNPTHVRVDFIAAGSAVPMLGLPALGGLVFAVAIVGTLLVRPSRARRATRP